MTFVLPEDRIKYYQEFLILPDTYNSQASFQLTFLLMADKHSTVICHLQCSHWWPKKNTTPKIKNPKPTKRTNSPFPNVQAIRTFSIILLWMVCDWSANTLQTVLKPMLTIYVPRLTSQRPTERLSPTKKAVQHFPEAVLLYPFLRRGCREEDSHLLLYLLREGRVNQFAGWWLC